MQPGVLAVLSPETQRSSVTAGRAGLRLWYLKGNKGPSSPNVYSLGRGHFWLTRKTFWPASFQTWNNRNSARL